MPLECAFYPSQTCPFFPLIHRRSYPTSMAPYYYGMNVVTFSKCVCVRVWWNKHMRMFLALSLQVQYGVSNILDSSCLITCKKTTGNVARSGSTQNCNWILFRYRSMWTWNSERNRIQPGISISSLCKKWLHWSSSRILANAHFSGLWFEEKDTNSKFWYSALDADVS